MSHTILLVDDHKIFREGLRALIEQHEGLQVIAEAEDGRAALEMARQLRPHLAIIDVGMPGLNGIEITRRIVAEVRGVKVIALSMYSDAKLVRSMLNAGARGYLLKDCAFEELENAIHAVLANHVYLSEAITGVVLDDYLHRASAARVCRLDPQGTRSAPDAGRGHKHQGDLASPACERENGRNPPQAHHGPAGPSQRRGADQVCRSRGADLAREVTRCAPGPGARVARGAAECQVRHLAAGNGDSPIPGGAAAEGE